MFPSSSGGRHEPVRITDHTLTERVLGKRGWGGCISSVAADGLMGLSQLCGESSVLPILESQLQGPKVFPLMMSSHYDGEIPTMVGRGSGGTAGRREPCLPANTHHIRCPTQEAVPVRGCREPRGSSGPGWTARQGLNHRPNLDLGWGRSRSRKELMYWFQQKHLRKIPV